MDNITNEEARSIILDKLIADESYENITKYIETCKNEKFRELLNINYADALIDYLTYDYIFYGKVVEGFSESEYVVALEKSIENLHHSHNWYSAFLALQKGENKICLAELKKWFSDKENEFKTEKMNEVDAIEIFVRPFKEGFSELWEEICKCIKLIQTEDGVPELLFMYKQFYASKYGDESIDILTNFIAKYPDFVSPHEILGTVYYDLKHWNNCIAEYEKVTEPVWYVFRIGHIPFMMAYSHDKVREYKEAEKYYRLCIENDPGEEFARNNLSYVLIRQKRYSEALEILEECLSEKKDIPNAANNYVSALIGLGRNKDAKEFIKNTEFSIAKDIKEKVKKLDNRNTKKVTEKTELFDESNDAEEQRIDKRTPTPSFQFSTEKILEDELTARIEAGNPVFGKKLKVYRRKGDYGRQYRIFVDGRIGIFDLLCEDDAGDLYIIELKKDSGYDDVYEQISNYLDWIVKEPKFKGKKAYGIICLNSPTKDLVEKVHKDPRMEIYNYQISYSKL